MPPRFRCLALLLAVLSMAPAAPARAEGSRTVVTVLVHQMAGLPPTFEERALDEAERVLRTGLVDVGWRRCADHREEHPAVCHLVQGPSDFSLRILRDRSPRLDLADALGEALVNRSTGRGVMATVFANRVEGMANVAGTDVAVLLGRVIAHELGHLLLRNVRHAPRGLMRESWTFDEVRRNRPGDWAFTARDVAAMRWSGPGS